MPEPLKSLEEYNNEQLKEYFPDTQPLGNGIACPNCGFELYDAEPAYSVVLSYPPKMKVLCPNCKNSYYKIV